MNKEQKTLAPQSAPKEDLANQKLLYKQTARLQQLITKAYHMRRHLESLPAQLKSVEEELDQLSLEIQKTHQSSSQ